MVQTIAEYQNKDNPYIKKYTDNVGKVTSTNMANFNPLNTQINPSSTASASGTFNPAGGVTALGNTAGNVANPNNPLLGTIQSEPFQPMYGGRNASKAMYNQSYNRMSSINDITDLANAAMQQRVDAFNQKVRQRNAAMQASSNGSFYGDTGSYFEGGADSGLDDEQLTNARLIANVGRQRGLSDGAIQIALMTALTESGLRNLSHGDRDSVGLFQQRTSQGWGSIQQIMDPNYSANKFYDALQKVNYGAMNPWNAAQAVQRSFDPSGSNYQKQWALAQKAFGSLAAKRPIDNSAVGNWITQNNNKYIDYDGYFGAQCVDLYNAYTASFVGGKNIMVGWAPEIYNNYDRAAYTRTGANVPGAMGYVAVFNRGGATPYGHVAIVVGDNGNGTLRVLQANATPQGSAGNTIISNISKATLMGYLVPNKLMGR